MKCKMSNKMTLRMTTQLLRTNSLRKRSIQKNRKKIFCVTSRRMKTQTMISMRMKSCHPFHNQCQSSETTPKPKDKREIESGWWSYPIADPGRTKSWMKPLKSYAGRRRKENENSTSKSKWKLTKKPPSIRYWTKQEESWKWEKRNKKMTRINDNKKLWRNWMIPRRLLYLTVNKGLSWFFTMLSCSLSQWLEFLKWNRSLHVVNVDCLKAVIG